MNLNRRPRVLLCQRCRHRVGVWPARPAARLDLMRCDRKMWEGFLLDRGDHDYQCAAEWIEGELQNSFSSGTKTKGRTRHRVQTYRCEKCGYLESYAPAQSS